MRFVKFCNVKTIDVDADEFDDNADDPCDVYHSI
jgi:hypothetical protein